MEISCLMDGCRRDGRGSQVSRRFAWKTLAHRLGCILLTVLFGGIAFAQGTPLVPAGDVISLVPAYATTTSIRCFTPRWYTSASAGILETAGG